MLLNVIKPKLSVILTSSILLLLASASFAQDSGWSQNVSPLPAPTGMVNDFAGVLDEATKQQLEARLRAFKEKFNPPVELAVVTVRTTGDRDIFDYSLAVARGWKIGSAEDDNPSALLFIAVDDRKYFTQISRDLEDELPDGLAGQIQRQYLVPEFRKGNYGKGISDTIDAYIRTIEERTSGGPATPTPSAGDRESRGVSQGLYTGFCCLAVLLVVGLIIWSNRGGGKSGKGRGGWGGGGFGDGASALPWIIGSAIASAADSSSSSSSWGSSDWGGGGGGSDWGGFGGGGDFGGGGAGGDW